MGPPASNTKIHLFARPPAFVKPGNLHTPAECFLHHKKRTAPDFLRFRIAVLVGPAVPDMSGKAGPTKPNNDCVAAPSTTFPPPTSSNSPAPAPTSAAPLSPQSAP